MKRNRRRATLVFTILATGLLVPVRVEEERFRDDLVASRVYPVPFWRYDPESELKDQGSITKIPQSGDCWRVDVTTYFLFGLLSSHDYVLLCNASSGPF
jgi:hypothetical protein